MALDGGPIVDTLHSKGPFPPTRSPPSFQIRSLHLTWRNICWTCSFVAWPRSRQPFLIIGNW